MLYVVADSTLGLTGILSFKSLVPLASSLYYVAILNATNTDNILISSGSFVNEYLLAVNTNSSSLSAFFLPPVPSLTINPPTLKDNSVFSKVYDFSVRVQSMNNQQESILANLNVLNSQTNVVQNNSNAAYLWN